jgi:hypothetical protein
MKILPKEEILSERDKRMIVERQKVGEKFKRTAT